LGWDEAVPRLQKIATAEEFQPAARLAAAQALVDLDAKNSASALADSARKYGADFRLIVEPALARWDYRPLREVWQGRLNSTQVHYRDLVLAIRCLAIARDETSSRPLLQIVHDPVRSPELRTEAARAAGIVKTEGLEADAQQLLIRGTTGPTYHRLIAVQLLHRHTGGRAQQQLEELAIDSEPAVAVVALNRLLEIDPRLVVPLAEGAMASPDPKIRRSGAEAYVQVPDPSRVAVLARLLNDPHPDVRAYVRESMFALARIAELDDAVRRSTVEMLSGGQWRGLEQAGLLLGALDHEPAAPRLLELLEFPRAEVAIAAAWALKSLAVPETLPMQLAFAESRTEQRSSGKAEIPGFDRQVAHLLESFGIMNYSQAEPLLRRYIPKVFSMGDLSRPAAIWSLGLLHKGVPDEGLAAQFTERITDAGTPLESYSVRMMSVVSIGRMKAVSQLAALRRYFGPEILPDTGGMTYRWALIQLTGEEIPTPERPVAGRSGWFLEPLDN
jgi:HEAT repeat protein